ncbi:MAG: hypothetical protein KAH14_04630 [Clostridiales bacterium]|nr:hypothetical protein [Clostridiales bacterium]
MKRKMKCVLVLILTLVLIMVTVTPAVASTNSPKKIDYVALGDSGAAGVRAIPGQLPGLEDGSDFGYTDVIANWLDGLGVLGKFDEKYSISGNTAALLAQQTSKADGFKRLKKAEIVTVTIGANDLIQPLYDYFNATIASGQPLSVLGAITALEVCRDEIENNFAHLIMEQNIEIVLDNIMRANSETSVYVMGYYNPLPCLVDFGFDMAPYVMLINDMINLAIAKTMINYPDASIDFIDTLGIINGILSYTPISVFPWYSYGYSYTSWYPYLAPDGPYLYSDFSNPLEPIADIHLTEEGYVKVANSFMVKINEDFFTP